LAYAIVQTPGNGTNRLFSVSFPFILRAHVKVYLNYDIAAGTGTELVDGTDFTWLSDTQIQTTVAPPTYTTLTRIRKTPNGTQLVVWAPGSPPTQTDLNIADLQSLYAIQEQADLYQSTVDAAITAAAMAISTANAVSAVLPYQPIASVSLIPASPTTGQRIEIGNTTGLGSFSPVAGRPAGFVGGTNLKARMIYGTPVAATWNWVDYYPLDPDGRYAGINFTQLGTGATPRGLTNKLQDSLISVKDFGADPTGSRLVADWGAPNIALIAGTATAGVAAQALILLFFWKRVGLKLSLNFKWRGVGLRPAAKAASWTLGMVLVTQLGGLVQTVIASSTVSARATQGLAIASIAASSIAWLVFMLPHSIATVSIATATFTKISSHAHEGDHKAFKSGVGASLRAILAVSAFASVALAVLAYPIARVFSGEYPATIALGNVIMAFMVGLVPFSFVFMLQRAFYALEDTRTPFVFTCIQTVVFVAGAITIAFTVEPRWLVAALALCSSASILVQAVVAYRLLRRKVGEFTGVGLAGATTRMLAAAVLSGAVGVAILWFTNSYEVGAFALATVLGAVIVCAGVGLVMALVYFAALALLGVEETWSAWVAVRKAVKGITRR
jgi:hypothetical protein